MTPAQERGTQLRGHIDDLIRDAQSERQLHEEQLLHNARMLAGSHRETFGANPENNYFTANLVNGVVVTQTAVMTERDIRPEYVPRETNEPPEIFLKPESAFKAQGMGLSQQQMAGEEVIPEQLFDFISAQTRTEEVDNPEAGQTMGAGENAETQPDKVEVEVPIFEDEDFIFVDDALCAEALTQELMSEWEVSGADEKVRQGIFEAVGLGWKDVLCQWNEQEHHFELVLLYPFNGWIDRWSTSTRDAEYYALLEIMPIAEALREYPEAAEQIQKNKTTATSHTPWGGMRGGKYDRSSEREVVEVYTIWERHFPYPMDPQQAMEQGLVEVAREEPLVDPDTGEVADMGGQPIVGEDGQPMFVNEQGQSTVPGDESWPVRYGIRQLRMLGNHILQEMEAEASDIPVSRIRNIPIPESPYGEGEPQRIGELQDLYNRLLSIYHDYVMFFRGTEQAMPNSVYDQLGDVVGTLHKTMGRKVGVPDDLWTHFNGNIIQDIPPAQLTPVFFEILRTIEDQISKISGINEVLRGEAKSEWSGALFQQATAAARGPIGFKARHVSDAIKYIASIIGNYIIDFLPLEEWAKRNKKYPPAVLEVMRSRLKEIGFDVSVEVGGAGSRQERAQQLTTVVQNNPQLSLSPTFMQHFLDTVGIKDGDKIVREVQESQTQAPQ